jgi:transcriptional regulator GlxA family with amidase domain
MDRRINTAETFLARRADALPPEAARIRDAVEQIERDHSLLRVTDVAALLRIDIRTLQRLFRRHVGVSPKWVVRRFRLHEAAELLRSVNPPSLADLALSLGYADQAHFARDFKLATGKTPRALTATGRVVADVDVTGGRHR